MDDATIEAILREHADRLHKGDVCIALMNQTVDTTARQVSDMHRAIMGNGRPGLKTDVAILKYAMGGIGAATVAIIVKLVWEVFAK